MDLAQLLAIALHTVAFVIAWGYYGILGRIVLPALRRSLAPPVAAATLVAIERRALPLVLISVILFIATGSYLLFLSPQYTGLGDFFSNTWSALMLVKHVVVVVLVVLGVVVDRLIRRAGAAEDEASQVTALGRAGLAAEAATGLGAVIVLLTAAAQLST
jgi:uncharacterized membrane protein